MLHLYINCALIFILIVMTVEDLRHRGIFWYNFLMLGTFLVLSKGNFAMREITMNVAFIVCVYGLVSAWFTFKNGRFVNLLDTHIGLGDWLFLICVGLYLPFSTFFAFYLSSTFLITAGTGAYLLLKKPVRLTIPLAGLQSALLLLAMVIAWANGMELHQFKLPENYLL